MNLEKLFIRKVTFNEAKTLQQLSKQTFFDAFSAKNNLEDMLSYAEKAFNLKQFEKELANPESEFFFAVYQGKVVGYLKMNSGAAQTEFQDADGFEVERLYISGNHQGKKFGEQLLQLAIAKAVEAQCRCIWLGVWEKNYDAIRFYERHGFIQFSNHPFMLGSDLQLDLLLRRYL